jgi:hypothetical protein
MHCRNGCDVFALGSTQSCNSTMMSGLCATHSVLPENKSPSAPSMSILRERRRSMRLEDVVDRDAWYGAGCGIVVGDRLGPVGPGAAVRIDDARASGGGGDGGIDRFHAEPFDVPVNELEIFSIGFDGGNARAGHFGREEDGGRPDIRAGIHDQRLASRRLRALGIVHQLGHADNMTQIVLLPAEDCCDDGFVGRILSVMQLARLRSKRIAVGRISRHAINRAQFCAPGSVVSILAATQALRAFGLTAKGPLRRFRARRHDVRN